MHYAQNVELLGILGFKSVINNRNSLLLDEIRRNGIKVFMLSTEDAQINITDCNAMRLFQDLNTPINVAGTTDREVEDSLKQCLKQIVDKRWIDPNKENSRTTRTTRSASKRKKSVLSPTIPTPKSTHGTNTSRA